jgi:hypothetical protein
VRTVAARLVESLIVGILPLMKIEHGNAGSHYGAGA